jgi:hypothetical protein
MTSRHDENEDAYRLVETPINIRGVGGSLLLSKDNKIVTSYPRDGAPAMFIMELVKESSFEEKNQRLVVFRLKGTDTYLTQNPYGNKAQTATLESISNLPLLPEIQQLVVDFAVLPDSPSAEGEGFDYDSMRLETGAPGVLQMFSLTGQGLWSVGVKSIYGKFWRAPQWSGNVLQSPHQLADETFNFVPAK